MDPSTTPVWRSPARGTLLESPVWCEQSNSLYWIDVMEPSIHRFRFDTSETDRWTLPKPPGSIALISPTRLFVAMRSALAILDVASGNLTPLSWEGPQLEEDRFNDGVTDRLVSA
jgi:L-arabinonolactonase